MRGYRGQSPVSFIYAVLKRWAGVTPKRYPIYDQSLRLVFFSATITSSSVPGGAGLALLPTTLFFLAWAMRCFRAVADVVLG